jgi:hypothetical protein
MVQHSLVECSIKGSSDSVRTDMIRVIQPQEERTVPLMSKGKPLQHDRHANRIIQFNLTYEGASGKYKRKKALAENEFFKTDKDDIVN